MTNRNRNRGKNKVTDRKVEMKEREEKVLPIISIISVVVSVMALVISHRVKLFCVLRTKRI